jgi:DNA polymerase IV
LQLAKGIDDRPVEPNRESKSSGSERTFAEDLVDVDTIRAETARMAERAASWLERRELFARTVTLKVRYRDFTTITRSHSEKPATRDPARIITRAVSLLDRTDAGARPVRLLGVSVHGLCEDPDEAPVRRRPDATLPFEEDADQM